MSANYSLREVIADLTVQLIGCAGSIVAAAVLIARALSRADPTVTTAAVIYSAGLIALLWVSAAYHLVRGRRWKARLRRYDHAAIFLLIAATYTPFALIGLGGPEGWWLLAAVWPVAIAGITLKLCRPHQYERLALVLYLALGWAALPLARELWTVLPGEVFVLLLAGGLIHTAGVLFYLWERLPYHNAVWHCFVLLAVACHYRAVMDLVAGTMA